MEKEKITFKDKAKGKTLTEKSLKNSLDDIAQKYGQKFKYTEFINDNKIHKLNDNQNAIYIYTYKPGNIPLKIGIVGPKSNPRLNYQHLNKKSCNSNLAAKLDKTKEIFKELTNLPDNPGSWIKENCNRFIIIYENLDIYERNLVESILHYHFKPIYEGLNVSLLKKEFDL